MLIEHTGLHQHPREAFRRLFWDDFLQLYVWFDDHAQIVGFELSYDLPGDYRAYRWKRNQELQHFRVDAGESRAMKKAVPLLHLDRDSADPGILSAFAARSVKIEPHIAGLVCDRLRKFFSAPPAPSTSDHA